MCALADCTDNATEAPGGKGLAWRVLTPLTSPLGLPSTRPYGFYKKHRTIWVSCVCCCLYHRVATGTSDRSWLRNINVVSIKMQAEKREWSWQQWITERYNNSTCPRVKWFKKKVFSIAKETHLYVELLVNSTSVTLSLIPNNTLKEMCI